MEKWNPHTVSGNVRWGGCCGKQSGSSPKMLAHDPAISLLGVYTQGDWKHMSKHTHKSVHSVHSNTIHKCWKYRTKGMFIYWWKEKQKMTIEYYSAIKRNEVWTHVTVLKKLVLNERSQAPKVAQCIPFIWNIENKQKHKDRRQIGCCLDRGGNE